MNIKEKLIWLAIVGLIVGYFVNKEFKKNGIGEKKELPKIELNNPMAREKVKKIAEKKKFIRYKNDDYLEIYKLHDYIKNNGHITTEEQYVACLDGILQKEIKPEEAPDEFYFDPIINDKSKKEAKEILKKSREVLTYNYNLIKLKLSTDKFKRTGAKSWLRPIWTKVTYPDNRSTFYSVRYEDFGDDLTGKKTIKFRLKKGKDKNNVIDGLDDIIIPIFEVDAGEQQD